MEKTWWKEAIVYQIYPRSFYDSDGDGVGDIPGIIQKLDYIKSLGVDVIWLCPVYKSPNDDNGYDISDYRNISDEFGGNTAFDQLLEGIHSRGMKLVMDLVANHTSDEHEWFEASRQSEDNPYRDYYYWKKGKNGGPPTNWVSFFSGSTWEYDEKTDAYYLHLFTRKQPDLNWENPKVRTELYDVIDYWFNKGVDGFRMDVISLISKRPDFSDADSTDYNYIIQTKYANGPRIHEFLKEMNREVLSKYDVMTVGEGPGINLDNAPLYVNKDRNELNMIFHFDHMFIDCGPGGKYDPIPFDLPKFKKVFSDWDECLIDGWGSIFLGNHDFSRMVSRFGNDGPYHKRSAKLLAMLLMTMRGTVYVYQGDEIGMTNVAFPSIDDYNDVETLNSWKEAEAKGKDMDAFLKLVHEMSRDNARTPMQWNDSKNAGFTEGEPWLKLNSNYPKINLEEQESDPDSILNFYRKMIAFRKANPCLIYGQYTDLDTLNTQLFKYERKDQNSHFMMVLNMSDLPYSEFQPEDNWSLLISNLNHGSESNVLGIWEGRIYQIN